MNKATLIIAGSIVGGLTLIFIVYLLVSGKPQTGTDQSSIPTITVTESPTTIATASPTATQTPTATPTVTATTPPTPVPTKTVTMTIKVETVNTTFKLQVPSDVTAQAGTNLNGGGTFVLKKGTKTFMMFNVPYELYEIQGYSSSTSVSSTISGLKRVRSKKVYEASGSYQFAMAYTSELKSGSYCTSGEGISAATTSPCAMPAVRYSAAIGFSAYCSVAAGYDAICDQVMKTIVVTR